MSTLQKMGQICYWLFFQQSCRVESQLRCDQLQKLFTGFLASVKNPDTRRSIVGDNRAIPALECDATPDVKTGLR
jgi:hypothetical protein